MLRTHLAILVVLSSCLIPRTSHGQENAQPIPAIGSIQGIVRGADGKPEQATIRLQQYTQGGRSDIVTSNQRGEFKLPGLPYGRYWLTIRGELAADVEVTSTQPSVNVTLNAPPWSILRGVVREKETGKPIAGALVALNLGTLNPLSFKREELGHRFEWTQLSMEEMLKLVQGQGVRFVVADDKGRYELKLGDEYGTVFAIAPQKELVAASSPIFWRLQGVQEQNFALEPTSTFTVRGRITLQNGKPFARQSARFYTRRHPDRFYDVTTDEQGKYEFVPNTYMTSIAFLEAVGYSVMHQYVPLDKDPPFPSVDWVLKPSQLGKASVSVLGPDGRSALPDGHKFGAMRSGPQPDKPAADTPGPHIYYRLEADRWGRSGIGLEVQNGKAIKAMEPGRYALYLDGFPLMRGNAANRKDIRSSFTNDRTAQPHITIQPGKATEMIFAELIPSAVTIKLTRQDGSLVTGINLAAFRWDAEHARYSGTWAAGATNEDGEILFDPLTPGEYVFHPATGSSDYEPLRRYPIKLNAGTHHRLGIVMQQSEIDALKRQDAPWNVRIAGQVLMPDGVTPAAFAAIYVERGKSRWVHETSPRMHASAEGKFVLEKQHHGAMTVSARASGTALTAVTIDTDNKKPAQIRLVLDRGATIHGRLLNKDRDPPVDVHVCVLDQASFSEPRTWGGPYGQGSHWLATPVRPDGRFTLYGVPPGKRYLCMYRQGWLQVNSVRTLDVRAGEEIKDVELFLEPRSAGLEIHFKRADGKPMLPQYETRLYAEFAALDYLRVDHRTNIARERGVLPPGRYHLWLDPTYGKRDLDMPPAIIERNIQVQPGDQVQKIEVLLPPAGAVQGRVLLMDGTPAAALRVTVHSPEPMRNRSLDPPLSLIRDAKGARCYTEAAIDPEGNFSLFGLVAGRYRLAVTWHGREEPIYVSDPVDVQGGRITQVGTWTLK